MPRKRRRIRDLLGLILQMLIAASLILAWAGPRSESKLLVEKPTLVVIDGSRSMAARDVASQSRIEAAQRWIRGEWDSLSSAGQVAVALASQNVTTVIPFGADSNRMEDFAKSTVELGAEVNAAKLLLYAEEVRAAHPETEFVLVTDRCLPDDAMAVVNKIGFRIVPMDTSGSNAGFTNYMLQTTTPGSITIDATIASYGATTLTGRVSLVANGSSISETEVTLAPGEKRTLVFETDVPESTWLAVNWSCAEDRFHLDDILEFWSPESDRLKVLVVAKDVNHYVKNALGALTGVFDLSAASRTDPGRWRQATGYDLTILDGVNERRPLPPGSYILLNSWAPNLPFKEGLKANDVGIVRQEKNGSLLRGVDLRDLEVKSASRISGKSGYETLLEGTHGPLITRSTTSSFSFLHVAFDTAVENSSLVLLPAFPLLIKDAARYLAPKPKSAVPSSLRTGATFATAQGDQTIEPIVVEYISDDGETTQFRDLDFDSGTGSFRVPERRGRARIHMGESQENCAINVCEERESNVFPAGASGTKHTPPPRKEKMAFSDQSGQFFLLALIFLLLEWLCYTRSWSR